LARSFPLSIQSDAGQITARSANLSRRQWKKGASGHAPVLSLRDLGRSAAVPSRSMTARGCVSGHSGSVAWVVLLRLRTAALRGQWQGAPMEKGAARTNRGSIVSKADTAADLARQPGGEAPPPPTSYQRRTNVVPTSYLRRLTVAPPSHHRPTYLLPTSYQGRTMIPRLAQEGREEEVS
jgi:hypothetical protein